MSRGFPLGAVELLDGVFQAERPPLVGAPIRTAIVAPITTTVRGLPSEVPVGIVEGLKEECVVNLDHIYTVTQGDLKAFVGTVGPEKMAAVCSGLAIALGCA